MYPSLLKNRDCILWRMEKIAIRWWVYGWLAGPIPATCTAFSYQSQWWQCYVACQLTFVLSSNLFFCSAMSITPLRALATSGHRVECWKYMEPPWPVGGGGGDAKKFNFRLSPAAEEYGRVKRSWDLKDIKFVFYGFIEYCKLYSLLTRFSATGCYIARTVNVLCPIRGSKG